MYLAHMWRTTLEPTKVGVRYPRLLASRTRQPAHRLNRTGTLSARWLRAPLVGMVIIRNAARCAYVFVCGAYVFVCVPEALQVYVFVYVPEAL